MVGEVLVSNSLLFHHHTSPSPSPNPQSRDLQSRRSAEMDKGSRETRANHAGVAPAEPDFPLQWGCRKRLRRIKVRDKGSAAKSGVRRGIASRNVRRIADQEFPPQPPLYPLRRSESAGSENHNSRSVSSSPDKDDRCYTTRGSAALVCEGENADERASAASLPRFFVSLSNKEKEEDFMAMKGCKLPQRPKKRSKLVQKCILLVSPGAWLSDLSQERYVVREKKGSRKRRRGLKAMSMESDSE